MAQVRTVTGPIDSASLGVTLFHEHLLLNGSGAWHPPRVDDAEGWEIARSPLRMEYLGRLRNDPYLSMDNTRLDSVDEAVEEAGRFATAGGATIVEQTLEGNGRDPKGLKAIAERTGLNVIMGCGFYLERSHPPRVASMTANDIADDIERQIAEGEDGIRAGVIGEIGISPDFTPAEVRVLRGAARAQQRCGVPLSVHLPGWLRYGGRVLDIVEEEGGNVRATVLAHMNPSQDDGDYQRALADRGAWIEYDMLGMEFLYPGEGQSPSDDANARAIAGLMRDGYGGRLLLSGDIFVKTLLRRYGGFGYAHIPSAFLPRLCELGVTRESAVDLLTSNPRAVFESAAEGARS